MEPVRKVAFSTNFFGKHFSSKSSSERSGCLAPCASRTTYLALASGAGIGSNAPVAAVFVKNDAVLKLSNIVAGHAVGMRATQLSDSSTVQIVDEVVVVKCNGHARSSVDVACHFLVLCRLTTVNPTRGDMESEDDYFADTHQKIELKRGLVKESI